MKFGVTYVINVNFMGVSIECTSVHTPYTLKIVLQNYGQMAYCLHSNHIPRKNFDYSKNSLKVNVFIFGIKFFPYLRQ